MTVTAAFLASSRPPIKPLQRYQADVAYVADAESQYSLGYPLTGGSFLQVASEEAHLVMLPAATGVTLYRAQRWLTRRTNRILSAGLVLASALLVISVVWLAAAFGVARSDLDRGIGLGSQPAATLAQASIGVQQIRGDAVLNLISRSGDASFQQDFVATSRVVGPGSGTLLTSAAAASTGSPRASSLPPPAQTRSALWSRP